MGRFSKGKSKKGRSRGRFGKLLKKARESRRAYANQGVLGRDTIAADLLDGYPAEPDSWEGWDEW